jgi:3-isopropylmalate/(R)-2-methylmalate dehydratase small subunit
MNRYHGRVWKFGDNVDTDAILPAAYLNRIKPDELAGYCFETFNPEFCRGAKKGDLIVAGENFGCGSSREHAPIAIKGKGISVVIAASFARIFFRNAFNVGLAVLESPEAASSAQEGDNLSVDFDAGQIRNETRGETYHFEPIPENMRRILDDGGLIPHLSSLIHAKEKQ